MDSMTPTSPARLFDMSKWNQLVPHPQIDRRLYLKLDKPVLEIKRENAFAMRLDDANVRTSPQHKVPKALLEQSLRKEVRTLPQSIDVTLVDSIQVHDRQAIIHTVNRTLHKTLDPIVGGTKRKGPAKPLIVVITVDAVHTSLSAHDQPRESPEPPAAQLRFRRAVRRAEGLHVGIREVTSVVRDREPTDIPDPCLPKAMRPQLWLSVHLNIHLSELRDGITESILRCVNAVDDRLKHRIEGRTQRHPHGANAPTHVELHRRFG